MAVESILDHVSGLDIPDSKYRIGQVSRLRLMYGNEIVDQAIENSRNNGSQTFKPTWKEVIRLTTLTASAKSLNGSPSVEQIRDLKEEIRYMGQPR